MCSEKISGLLDLKDKQELGEISQDMVRVQNNVVLRELKRKGG